MRQHFIAVSMATGRPTEKGVNEYRETSHGLMEDVGQRVQTSMLMRVYHRVASQGHVQKLGRVTDDLGLAKVTGVTDYVQEAKPALDDAVVVHSVRDQQLIVRWKEMR